VKPPPKAATGKIPWRIDIIHAAEALRAELAHAASTRDDGGVTRDGVLYAVASVVEFMTRLGWHNEMPPIVILMEALRGLDDGSVSPLLAPTVFANRPPATTFQRTFKARAVASVKFLQAAGVPAESARAFVADLLVEAGYKFPSSTKRPSAQVGGWVSHYSQMSATDCAQYEAQMQFFGDGPWSADHAKAAVRKATLTFIGIVGTREIGGA
jgi:hypothetical protein